MANYHSDKWIMDRMMEHYKEGCSIIPEKQVVGLFYQGSGNYGLDVETSDVDTRMAIVPTFHDIAMNKKAISTTHIRANEEHIDLKDIRNLCATFKKQNMNFVELLFTPYKEVNPLYQEQWDRLVREREVIARYSPYQAVKTMKGIAMEKYHAMEHEYPSKLEVLAKYGYDPKQLHHLLRVLDFLDRYIRGEAYEDCLRPRPADLEYLKKVKMGCHDLETARAIANAAIKTVTDIADGYTSAHECTCDPYAEELIDDVQYEIMKIAVE